MLILAVVASALLEVWAEVFGRRGAVYVLKPATTSLILMLAVTSPSPISGFYQAAVIVGLASSLAGDVFLMLPSDRFLPGLASFLLGHLCYIAAFVSKAASRPLVVGVLLLAWGAFLMTRLWRRLDRLRLPVAVYALVLLFMAWTAIAQVSSAPERRALFAAAGATLFVFSDSALALERFVRRHRWGQPLVLLTYFGAQLLIALSVESG